MGGGGVTINRLQHWPFFKLLFLTYTIVIYTYYISGYITEISNKIIETASLCINRHNK